ncbi:hypothetical protein XENTR_v10004934 [Xenopus tropicalis]|nr:hypothetical protein XENTR_v10004934 [Xenopus tropicalis]
MGCVGAKERCLQIVYFFHDISPEDLDAKLGKICSCYQEAFSPFSHTKFIFIKGLRGVQTAAYIRRTLG